MLPHRYPEYDEAVPPSTEQEKRAKQVYPVPNADFVHAVRVAVPPFTTAPPGFRWIQLPDMSVLDDMSLLIKAWAGNPVNSIVTIAETAAYTQNFDTSYPLSPNEAVLYRIRNASALYASASVAACWVVISAEQRR